MPAQSNTSRAARTHDGVRVNGAITWPCTFTPPPTDPPEAACSPADARTERRELDAADAAASRASANPPQAGGRRGRRRIVPELPGGDPFVDVDAAERARIIRTGATYGDGTGFGRWTPAGMAVRIRQASCPPHVRAALSRALASMTGAFPDALLPQNGPLVSTRISGRDVWGATPEPAPWANTPVPSPIAADYIARCPRSQYPSRWPPLALWTWDRGHPETARRHISTCGSWRCDGCAPRAAALAFARMREALAPYAAGDVVFAVLTLDRLGRESGHAFASIDDAMRQLSRALRLFMKRLNRWCRRFLFCEGPGSRWVATVEAHRSGWPHINVVMVCPGLAECCAGMYEAALSLGRTERQAKLAQGLLLHHLQASGWGSQCTFERARSKEALAGYLGNLAKAHDQTIGEIAKLTQRPDLAGKSFRRIRSGVGFLPPRRKSEMTGVLLQSWATPAGPVVHVYGRRSVLDATTVERWATRTAEADIVVAQEGTSLLEACAELRELGRERLRVEHRRVPKRGDVKLDRVDAGPCLARDGPMPLAAVPPPHDFPDAVRGDPSPSEPALAEATRDDAEQVPLVGPRLAVC